MKIETGHAFQPRPVLIAYVLLFVSAFWLLFYHLDSHLLWGDEAETAVLAREVVQFGVPQTFDGTNFILLHGRIDETPAHVWIWSPWMQNYLAAGSFILFGESTWSARAPFALIGWCCLPLLAWLVFKIYRDHWVTIGAVALFATSEVFLLQARQCRYYPLSVFSEIILVFGVFEMLAARRHGAWLVALALILQYYSNYIIAVANLPAVLCLVWTLRKQGRTAILRVAAVLGILFVAALPWLLYAQPWRQKFAVGGDNYSAKALQYLAIIHFLFIPLWIFVLPLFGLFSRGRKAEDRPEITGQWERFLLLLLPLYLLVILSAPGCYSRYALPLLPLMCVLASAWVFRYVKWRALAMALLLVQMTTNFFPIISAFPFRNGRSLRSPLTEYVSDLATPYTDRFADVLDFFKTNARPGQTVLSFDPEFPLVFYAHLVVINGHFMGIAGKAPDWILPLPASGIVPQAPAPLPDVLKPDYTPISIPVHDSPLGDSLPEPGCYQYHTAQTTVPFLIYKLNGLTDKPVSQR
jgi:4-amino-4-deoxy-L-arabinose transferase-like glycosyltransferase